MSRRRLKELQGYVSLAPLVGRAFLFAVAVTATAGLLRTLHQFLPREVQSPVWWGVPTTLFAAGLYAISRRWTGGPAFRDRVRADIASGMAAFHLVNAIEAVEFEEAEDEGPVFFLLADDGTTFAFSGQYLARYRAKGFPWRAFEIVEAPESKIFFGLKPCGERLQPSARHAPLSWEAYKRVLSGKGEYAVVNVEFEELRDGRITMR